MNTYVLLLRGVNVGGKSKLSMTELKLALEALGYTNVSTYIASGNVVLDTTESAVAVTKKIEEILVNKFKLDSENNKILVLTHKQLEAVVDKAPKGFGKHPDEYYCDVLFLIDAPTAELMEKVDLNPEVDSVWEGDTVVYFQRLGAKRTKSKLSRIIGKPIYKHLTIRNWNTTTKLLDILSARE
jgi:uncharacterized protein (DUF1697 family)